VGHRFIELAQRHVDAAEPLLQAACFVVPVPSRAVRVFLEAERQRRSVTPLHQHEREDAPPQVLRELWRHLASIAPALGIDVEVPTLAAEVAYDPALYQALYQRLLIQRLTLVVPVDTILPTTTLSVYDFAVPRHEVVPTITEVTRFIRAVEQQYPDLNILAQDVERWYMPS
jgi:hypothetical protein